MSTSRQLKGFTLIELLVVIAIIGILSSVVLASLNTARAKGSDASVRTNLANARGQAELFYSSNNGVYVGTPAGADDVCAPSASASGTKGIYSFAQAAAAATGATINAAIGSSNPTNASVVLCHATPASGTYAPLNAWAMEAPLKGTYPGYPTPFFCVDSTGIATMTPNSTLAALDAKCF